MTKPSKVIATAWRGKNFNEQYVISWLAMKSPETWMIPDRKKAT
jgi:hypothetical protein